MKEEGNDEDEEESLYLPFYSAMNGLDVTKYVVPMIVSTHLTPCLDCGL